LKDRVIVANPEAPQQPHRAQLRSAIPAAMLFALCTAGVHLPAQLEVRTGSSPAASSPSTGQPSTQLKIESNLVIVKVTIRDAEGHLVPGLKKEDFRLFDRGKEQPIAQFEETLPHQSLSSSSMPQTSNGSQSAEAQQRYIAFYFDDLNSSAADLIQARNATDAYLATGLHDGDQVAVFTTSAILTDFTADPRRIHDALKQLNSHAPGRAALPDCPDLSDYQAQEMLRTNALNTNPWRVALDEAHVCAPPPDPRSTPLSIAAVAERVLARALDQARANLLQFDQVIKYIAQAPGQRTVILASSGFLSEDAQLIIDRTVDRALRSQVTINSLNPSGLTVMLRESDASRSSISIASPRTMQTRDSLDAGRALVANGVLAAMAQGTGGIFFHDDNDLKAGLETLLSHPENYTLAFEPRDMKLDGKFHDLKVTLADKHKGYSILGRRGYFAVAPGAEPPPPADAKNGSISHLESSLHPSPPGSPIVPIVPPSEKTEEKMLQDALNSKSESSGLQVSVDAAPSEGQGQTRLLAMTVHVDSREIPLRKQDGHNLDALTFVVAVFDDKENLVEIKDRHANIDLQTEELPDFLNNGVDVNFMFELMPGKYRLRIAGIESVQHRLGTLSRHIDIP
jgi:VWFA-related protein